MKPGRIDGANGELGRPEGWDEAKHGPCETLNVRHGTVMDGRGGFRIVESAWYPSPEEITAMQRGAPVILTVAGTTHPPVSLGTGVPPVSIAKFERKA